MKSGIIGAALAASAAVSAYAQPQPISFDQAIAEILVRSTGIATQNEVLGALVEHDRPIRFAFAPSISVDASRTNSGGANGFISIYNSQVEGVAKLNLFRWGADIKNWQGAMSDETSQSATVEDTWLSSESGAVAALVGFVQFRKQIDVAGEIVKAREDSLAIAQQRYDGGYLPLQEMQRVSVDLANAQAQLADARVASANADASLVTLLGHDNVTVEWPWTDKLVLGPQTALPDDAVVKLLSQRPDWRAAQAKVDAEDARLSRNWRLLGPSLDGQASYGYYYSDYSTAVSPSGPLGGQQWQGSLTVTLPLFDHLLLFSNAREQSFVRGQADTALEQVRRSARAEWEAARQVYATALASAQVRDKTLLVSRRLYQDNLQRFRNGRINADDLVLEQTRLYSSELNAVQGWASAHGAYARLCRAQGQRLRDCKAQ